MGSNQARPSFPQNDSDPATQNRTGTTPTPEIGAFRAPSSTGKDFPPPLLPLTRPELKCLDEEKACSDVLNDYESVEVDLVVSAYLPLGSLIKKQKEESNPLAL